MCKTSLRTWVLLHHRKLHPFLTQVDWTLAMSTNMFVPALFTQTVCSNYKNAHLFSNRLLRGNNFLSVHHRSHWIGHWKYLFRTNENHCVANKMKYSQYCFSERAVTTPVFSWLPGTSVSWNSGMPWFCVLLSSQSWQPYIQYLVPSCLVVDVALFKQSK